MSIRNTVDDAIFLWKYDRFETALLVILTAIAATARKRFPYPQYKDRESFESFLTSATPGRLMFEFRGECHTIEHLLYKFIRCNLVHENGLPVDIEFMPDKEPISPGSFSIRAGGAPEFVLKISYGFFFHLINIVANAKENLNDFQGWHFIA
jgi:hypothetical protein